MDLKNMMLSEKVSHKMSHIVQFHLYVISRRGKSLIQKAHWWLPGAEGGGQWGVTTS